LKKIEEVYHALKKLAEEGREGVTAREMADVLQLDRSTASRYLNELEKQKLVGKTNGKPVVYYLIQPDAGGATDGAQPSLSRRSMKDDSLPDNHHPISRMEAADNGHGNPSSAAAMVHDPRNGTANFGDHENGAKTPATHDENPRMRKAPEDVQGRGTTSVHADRSAAGIEENRTAPTKHGLSITPADARYEGKTATPDGKRPRDGFLNKEPFAGAHPESERLIGADGSLKPLIEKGLAALLYPAKGLHILLSGETGVGKSHFAEYLANIAARQMRGKGKRQMPFVVFNCADYSQNPELLMGHIFGIKRGAFTGATKDERGLVDQADNGILFLDEIHRLPPAGQEMLFYLIDKGIYRRLGEADVERHANIVLIGATTESLEATLLPTLLRRFSVKINIPSLRERPLAERDQFLHYFLEQEAKKMGAPLSIEAECREAFLKYVCPGNIGQLKSDIQISCAKAFMRYLQNDESVVTIKKDDLPPHVISSLVGGPASGDDQSHYLAPEADDALPIPSIYSQWLKEKENGRDPSSLNETFQRQLDHYINELKVISEKRLEAEPGWSHFIDRDLLDALRESEYYFKDQFPFPYTMKQLIAIGLHLQAYRLHAIKGGREQTLPVTEFADPVYREAARQLAEFLNQRIQLYLPDEEIELIAHLLASPFTAEEKPAGVSVFVVTHGASTATSMAEVTNYLLGNPVIQAVDMPLDEPTSVTYERLSKMLKAKAGKAGVLMLVDIGSLVTMGDALARELGIPIKTLANVNLPMLIEAGRKALIPENDLDAVYRAVKKAFWAMAPETQFPDRDADKRRLIATVCFTGEGTAQLLQEWIDKKLSPLDEDVVVRSIRIDPVTRDDSLLQQLKEQYHLIAVVGTVPISLPHIPFIPAWELFKEDGHTRLERLLEMTRPEHPEAFIEPDGIDDYEEMKDLVEKGLAKIVRCLNPSVLCGILEQHMPAIRAHYGWDLSRELGMWMHIGSLVDQIIQAQLLGDAERLDRERRDVPARKTPTPDDFAVWQPLFEALEAHFHLTFSEKMKKDLVALA